MGIIEKLFGRAGADALPSTTSCGKCGAVQPGHMLAKCPSCEHRFCPGCAKISDIVKYRDRARNLEVVTVVSRCPRDGALLRKANVDPFVEALRGLENENWSSGAIDPKNEIGAFDQAAAFMARRYLAIGMTIHANPVITFGLLGAALRINRQAEADKYLRQCSRDFEGIFPPPELARSLLEEYVVACLENTDLVRWARHFRR